MKEYLIEPWDSETLVTGIDLDMYVPPEVDELAQIVITYYDMEVQAKTLITAKSDKGGAIWKIETNHGPRSLKLLHRKPIRSLFSIGAQDYLVKQGARVPELKKTKEGALYVEQGGKLWIVTDWIESLTPATKDLAGAQALCYGLGEFHKHSRGYVPPIGAKKVSRLHGWPAYYQEIITKMNWFRNIAKAYDDIQSSQSLFSVLGLFERQARDALSFLEQSAYAQMVALGEEHWGLVHQDYGWSNGQLGPGGLWVIDLDGVAYDLPIRDLRKLIAGTMDDLGRWDVAWILGMIDAYHQANPLDKETYEILLNDLAFPNEFYKHVNEMLFDPVSFLNNSLEIIIQHLVLLEKTKGMVLNELRLEIPKFKTGNYDSRAVREEKTRKLTPKKTDTEKALLPSLPVKESSPLKAEGNKHLKKHLNKKNKKNFAKDNGFVDDKTPQIDQLLLQDIPVRKDENQKLKVLMICTEKLPVPPVRGGAIQTYIEGISGFLSKHHDLTILGTTDPSLAPEEYKNKIRYVRKDGKQVFEIYAEEVVSFLKNHSFDLIHVFNRPRLVPLIRTVAPNSRIILSMHNDMFNPDKIQRDEAINAINEVERIITVSDYVGNTISVLYPQAAAKVHTIYSGVNLNTFIPWEKSSTAAQIRRKLRQEYNLESKTVILFVGRLTPKKGIDLLVQAVNEVYSSSSNIALVIVGGTWYSEDRLTDYVAYVRSLAERVPFPVVTTGYVAADHIHEWFWAADIFVCPSQWQEPLARVHYEAMAAGLPFVTTARGGNPEVVMEQNGLIVERPEDAKEFAQKLKILLNDPKLRQTMGRNGRRLAESRFGWERVAQEVLDVWKPGLSEITDIVAYEMKVFPNLKNLPSKDEDSDTNDLKLPVKVKKLSQKKKYSDADELKLPAKANKLPPKEKDLDKAPDNTIAPAGKAAGSSVVKITRDMFRY